MDASAARAVTVRRSVVLGVVQGLSEVVPVSSSAQLVLVPWLLGWPPAADRTLDAALLHAGSCAGITWALRRELADLTPAELGVLAATSVPAALAGLVGHGVVEQRLGRPPQLASLLAAAGLLLWQVDRRAERAGRTSSRPATRRGSRLSTRTGTRASTRTGTRGSAPPSTWLSTRTGTRPQVAARAAVGLRAATWAGLAQAVALVPGVSRSGATLTALRACGVERAAAQRFSLLMSLPVTAGAAGLTIVRHVRRVPAERSAGAGAPRASARPLVDGRAAGIGAAALASGVAATAVERAGLPLAPSSALYRLAVAATVAVRLRRTESQPMPHAPHDPRP